MKFFTSEKLGPTQSVTPEGFLLCQNVPLARTTERDGPMLYGDGETQVSLGRDGLVRIDRSPEEVFRAETVASFNGKPVVDAPGHPPEDVLPTNWRDYTVGVVTNPRRGQGIHDDCMVGDLLIWDQVAIDAIRAGKREVSCGYNCDYFELEPGRGLQRNIIGNHVALVDAGRCGPRCAIGDSASCGCSDHQTETEEEVPMTLKERIKAAFKSKDESALTTALEDMPEGENRSSPETHVHVHVADAKTKDACDESEEEEEKEEKEEEKSKDKAMDAAVADRFKQVDLRLDGLSADVKAIKDAVTASDEEDGATEDGDTEDEMVEGSLEMEVPEGATHDAKGKLRKMRDSAPLADAFQETVSLAEIILPGVRVPTFDAKQMPKRTITTLCNFRRRVLDQAYTTDVEVRDLMDELIAGRDFKKYTCDGVQSMFRAVGVMKKRSNQDDFRPTYGPAASGGGTGIRSQSIRTIADLNKHLAEHYNKAH